MQYLIFEGISDREHFYKWRGMLILNLRHGFDVIGTYTDNRGEPKIILEKKLAQQ